MSSEEDRPFETKIYTKGEKDFLINLKALYDRFKGKSGDTESESAVSASKQDLKNGFVWFWSDNSDIAKLILRSRGGIEQVYDYEESVRMKVNKKVFRGITYAFKVDKKVK